MTSAAPRSLFWKLFLPIGAALGLCALAAAIVVPRYIERNAEQEAVSAARETARQFTVLRQYYTANVVAKVMAHPGLRAGSDHLDHPDTIPLPATMVLELGELLRDSGVNLKLYSPYPFPNRAHRVLDSFGEDAWAYFQRHPDQPYTRTERLGSATVVRVALADRMIAQSCVDCHNSLPTSPRTDWKLGDVRGVLEVDSSLQLETGRRAIYAVLATLAALLLLAGLFLSLFYRRAIAGPLDQALEAIGTLTASSDAKVAAAQAIAAGDLDRELAAAPELVLHGAAPGNDELGSLLRSVQRNLELQRALDGAFAAMLVSLRASRLRDTERDWLKTSQNELAEAMRGDFSMAELADRVLRYLAQRLGAGLGALYLLSSADGALERVATYALLSRHDAPPRLAPGQGLPWQALRERRMLCLDPVPADYMAIGSALGAARPTVLTVWPLWHGDTAVGVLELGAFRPCTALEQELMALVREACALGFSMQLAHQHTAHLLHQARGQRGEGWADGVADGAANGGVGSAAAGGVGAAGAARPQVSGGG
ncbi:MAG TPA: DUF3365 domain-containing protein [Burkholderiaceae bacterium]|nr:DUF3365 domain-containing protein [Burkholderiaceae bacterium]